MEKIYSKPSFYVHILNVIFVLYILIVFYNNFENKQIDKLIIILLLFSIVFSLHGLSHLFMEYIYNYNPLELI